MKKNIIIILLVIVITLFLSYTDIVPYIKNTHNLSTMNLNDNELEEYINKHCVITDGEDVYKTICNTFCNILSLTARKEFYKRDWKIVTIDEPLSIKGNNMTVGCTSIKEKLIILYSKDDDLDATLRHELLHYCIYLYQYKINYFITKDLNDIYKEEKNNLVLNTEFNTTYAKSDMYEYYCNIYEYSKANDISIPKSKSMINKILTKVNRFTILK